MYPSTCFGNRDRNRKLEENYKFKNIIYNGRQEEIRTEEGGEGFKFSVFGLAACRPVGSVRFSDLHPDAGNRRVIRHPGRVRG